MATVRASMRTVLRHMKRLPTAEAAESPYRMFFFEKIRERRGETDKARVSTWRRQLFDYAKLVEATHEQKVGQAESS